MQLEELLLRKEELPISHETRFVVPIHPSLLRSDIRLNPNLAKQVFRQAAEEWYADLTVYTERLENGKTKSWHQEVFLREPPKVSTNQYGRQTILNGMWGDLVQVSETGFVHGLSISRDAGGSLYYNNDDLQSCRDYIHPQIVLFSPEKFDAYAIKKFPDNEGVFAHTYGHHNVDYYPGALFLRNWSMLYLNEAMKELGEEVMNRKT